MGSDKKLRRYPGTKPFEENESQLFKGRDEDIKSLKELIAINEIVVLYGRSGLGKSSLLNAGLANSFKEDAHVDAIFIRFGAHFKENVISPLQKLTSKLEAGASAKNFLSEKFGAEKDAWTNKLWYHLKNKQLEDQTKDTFVLIFDQFEEIATYPKQDIALFKKQLSELLFAKLPQEIRNSLRAKLENDKNFLTKEETSLLFNPLNIRILLSLRSDKLSLLNDFKDCFPSILQTCYEIKPLNSIQARAAIVEPAKIDDPRYASPPFTYRNDLLDKVISSLLPLKKDDEVRDEIETFQLQLVCKYAEDIVIERDDIDISEEDMGDISAIFENHYKNIIRKLAPGDQLPARTLMEEKLIIDGLRVSLPIPFVLRDPGMTKALLDELIATHIIRPEQNNTVEISHDTLIAPIMKFYQERKNEEAIGMELREKEEQIKRMQQEQEAALKQNEARLADEMRKVRRRRRKMVLYSIVGTATIIVSGLIAFIMWQDSNQKEKDEFFDNRKAGYQYVRTARSVAANNPTASLPYFDTAMHIISDDDSDAKKNIEKAINDVRTAGFFYQEKIRKPAGTFIGISDDGTLIITGSGRGKDSLWNADGKFVRSLNLADTLCAAGFSANKKKVLLGTSKGKLIMCGLPDGQEKEIGDFGSAVISARYSSDNKHYLVITADHVVSMFDSSGKQTGKLQGVKFNVAIFSRNNDSVFAAGDDGTVTAWSLQGRRQSTYANWNAPIHAMAFTPNGGRFVTGNDKGFFSIWHRKNPDKPLVSFGDIGTASAVFVLDVHKDTTAKKNSYSYIKICSGDVNGNIKIWLIKYAAGDDLPEHQYPHLNTNMFYWPSIIGELKGHTGKILSFRMMDPVTLVTTSADGTVKRWDITKIMKKESKGKSDMDQ